MTPLLSLAPSPSSLSLSDYFRLPVRLGLTSDGGMGSLQRLSSITDADLSLPASATTVSRLIRIISLRRSASYAAENWIIRGIFGDG